MIINRTIVVVGGDRVRRRRLHHPGRGARPAGRATRTERLLAVAAGRPPWSRWRSSRCAAAWSAWPTGSRTDRRAQPYEALADFSRRLAGRPAPGRPAAGGRGGGRPGGRPRTRRPRDARRARAPTSRSRRLGRGRPGRAATDPRVPVRDDGRVARLDRGRPAARPRSSRRPTPRLLEALADQAAIGVPQHRPRGQLAGRVAELDAHHPASWRSPGCGSSRPTTRPAARLEAAIARQVLPAPRAPAVCASAGSAAVAAGEPTDSTPGRRSPTRARGAARADPRRLPHPARPVRARAGAALAAGPERPRHDAERRRVRVGRRFAPRVEAAVYFCCAEAARADPARRSPSS